MYEVPITQEGAAQTDPTERLALTLAARAHLYYGPPDLRCHFVKSKP
jgi:hypothetical protein